MQIDGHFQMMPFRVAEEDLVRARGVQVFDELDAVLFEQLLHRRHVVDGKGEVMRA